jgi:minor extracellular serine protease Vpr
MVKFILTLFSCTLAFSLTGQATLSPSLRMLLSDVRSAGDDRVAMERMAGLHDLQRADGRWYVMTVALVDEGLFDEAHLPELDVRINSRMDGGMYTMRLPLDRLNELAMVPGLLYIGSGTMIAPDLEHSRKDTRADSVNAGLGGLSMGFTGEGVVIAVIDWGFDYTHPVFRDASLSGLRISRAWDQNKLAGPPPQGYGYGTEYIGAAELLAAAEDTLYVFGPMSHGTHVAGIAGGNGAGTADAGMAPDAELVFISLLRTDAGFIDAVNYVRDHALSVGKPFVVNMSFGSHLGPHDGTMPREQAMDQIAGPGRVFVGSAGNNGTGAFHLLHQFNGPGDTLRTVIGFGNVADHWGQAVPVWGVPGGAFGLGLLIVDASNNIIHETPIYHSADDPLLNDTLLMAAGDTIFMRLAGEAASPWNNRPGMVLEVRRTAGRRVVLQVVAEEGEVHMWNVMRLHNRYTNWGVDLGSNYTGAVGGDNEFAVGEPAGVGQSVITVASHRATQIGGSGNPLYGGLSTFSSRGPTVDGRTKPDISAPGQLVRSSVNSFDPSHASASVTVEFEGNQYPFASLSGTSMSAPAVTGIVALMLQAQPLLDAGQVKQILKETARLDVHTGDIGPEGDLAWGWGKVNALAAVLAATAVVSTPEMQMAPADVRLYPNPADEVLRISGMDVQRVRIYSMSGQLLLERQLAGNEGQEISLSGVPAGASLVELIGKERTVYHRLIIQ